MGDVEEERRVWGEKKAVREEDAAWPERSRATKRRVGS